MSRSFSTFVRNGAVAVPAMTSQMKPKGMAMTQGQLPPSPSATPLAATKAPGFPLKPRATA